MVLCIYEKLCMFLCSLFHVGGKNPNSLPFPFHLESHSTHSTRHRHTHGSTLWHAHTHGAFMHAHILTPCSQPPSAHKQCHLFPFSLSSNWLSPWHTHTHTYTECCLALSWPVVCTDVTVDKGRHHSRHTHTHAGPSRGGSCIPAQAHRHTNTHHHAWRWEAWGALSCSEKAGRTWGRGWGRDSEQGERGREGWLWASVPLSSALPLSAPASRQFA